MFTILQAAAQNSAAATNVSEKLDAYQAVASSSGVDTSLILSIIAIVIAALAAAAAVLAYLKAASIAKKSSGSSGNSDMIDQKIDVKLNSMLTTLKKECASETETMIGTALNTFEMKLKNQARIEEEKSQSAQSEQPQPIQETPVYPSKTWYAYSTNGKFDELDFSELQGARESFIIRTTADTTADVSLNPDFDRNLISEVKDICEVAEGNWQSFNTVTVVSDGTLSKPSKDSQSWSIVKKIIVKLG